MNFAVFLGAWMGFVVNIEQPGLIDAGIDLGG